MGFIERSVTVNFTNQTSQTLYRTDWWTENDKDYSYTNPPSTIDPWQTVTWKNAESDLANTAGYVNYKFTRADNGQDGHIRVGWNDPIAGSNSYDISCDSQPPYLIMYSGGDGTSPTIDVRFVERSVTVNFTNQTSRRLYKKDLERENDQYTNPPDTIDPWQTVTWRNAEPLLLGKTAGYVIYSFTRADNGPDGIVRVGWDYPIAGDHSYDISCDPAPHYGVVSNFGGGTSTTLNVLFVERDLSLTYISIRNEEGFVPTVNGDFTSVGRIESGFGRVTQDAAWGWAFVDLSTGKDWTGTIGAVVKIKNALTQNWLVVYSSDGNRVGLYPPQCTDYEDQHWIVDQASDSSLYVCFRNAKTGGNLVGYKDGSVFVYTPISSNDQIWVGDWAGA